MAAVRFGAYWGDPLLAERALARALVAFGPARRIVLFGDEIGPDRLLAELSAHDLFGERRAIVVRRADPLRGEGRLVRALRGGLPPDLALFLLGEDLRGPLAELAEETTGFPTPTGRDLRELAVALLKEADAPREGFVVDLVVEASGGDTLRLAREVEKLCLWKGARLSPEVLARLLFFSGGPPYPYLDAVGTRDVPTALRELNSLFKGPTSAPALFFALVGHVRALLSAHGARQAGRVPPGPAWLVRRRLAQARAWGEVGLVDLLARLQDLDLRVKTGQLRPEDALVLATLRLAQPSRG